MPFSKLISSPDIEQSLKKNNYIEPTTIQEKVIPLLLNKNDIIAKAQTGSGKTASFVLPILKLLSENIKEGKPKVQVLVLTPTRELTNQVANVFKIFSEFLPKKPKIVTVIGGEHIGEQLLSIQKGCNIVVATSGRLTDIINKKQINLSNIEFFVLDEADKMLDLGFEQELNQILNELPLSRTNLLFSATYPQKMKDIAYKITKEPIEIQIENETPTVEKINQRAIEVNKENRNPLLRYILENNKYESVLVFMANKKSADNIAAKFRKYGFKADSFHGNLIQEDREYTLEDFKSKKINILFATDIAARGLHIDDISCVINYDLPRSPNDYVHRVGRTGRAGKEGTAISFITNENSEHFKLIEKKCKINIKKEVIEGFERVGNIVKKVKGNEPIKGKRKSKKDKLRENLDK